MSLVRGAYLDFSSWSEVGNGQKLRNLSAINQVLAAFGQLLERLLFDFLNWWLQIMV